MRSSGILIIDDEVGIRDLLSEIPQDEGYTVILAENVEEAYQLRYQTRPAMALLDIWTPDCDGITLLKEWVKNGQLNIPVVMMSGHASIDTAVEAIKIGAFDFLEKPIALQKLLSVVERASKHGEVQTVSGMTLDKPGNSPIIQEMNGSTEAAAKHNRLLLSAGEVGSSFEVVARYLHKSGTPWVAIDRVEHIVDTPLELLQKASGDILYVGDIACYSKNIQNGVAFLLEKADRYNVRVIAPCGFKCGESADDVVAGRLAGLLKERINIPSLRSQPDDIVFLISRIMTDSAEGQKIQPVKFSDSALVALRQYDWPDNYDQLAETVRNIMLGLGGKEVDDQAAAAALGQKENAMATEITGGFNFNMPLRESREEVERRYLEYHIAQGGQNTSRVAQKVGLERTYLYRKLKRLGISISRRSADRSKE